MIGERARIVILNTLSGRPDLRFIALLVQGIPRSCKLDSQLSYVDVPLCALEQAAVQVVDQVAKSPTCWRWRRCCWGRGWLWRLVFLDKSQIGTYRSLLGLIGVCYANTFTQ